MVYPPWESFASALPQPNFPAEYKSHNLCVDVVDPIRTSYVLMPVHCLYFQCEWRGGGRRWGGRGRRGRKGSSPLPCCKLTQYFFVLERD